jgi:hypothetical protein
MKKTIFFVLFLVLNITFAQEPIKKEKYTEHNKGKFYVFWGGNRESFSRSDIHFYGSNYDFTLHNVGADDKPKGWQIDYVNPARMTIPQTNFRMGYFINDHYNVSLGLDHMKYVMVQNQTVNITGTIDGNPPFNGTYTDDPIELTYAFLTFEHTDGLNYINSEFSRYDDLSKLFKIKNTDKFQINITEGLGAGVLLPKTNAKLFDKPRHDDFHLSGYGVSAKIGLNFTFFKHFFIETELKGGFITMNDIRTTYESSDRAEQKFFFLQRIIAFGGIFKI